MDMEALIKTPTDIKTSSSAHGQRRAERSLFNIETTFVKSLILGQSSKKDVSKAYGEVFALAEDCVSANDDVFTASTDEQLEIAQ